MSIAVDWQGMNFDAVKIRANGAKFDSQRMDFCVCHGDFGDEPLAPWLSLG